MSKKVFVLGAGFSMPAGAPSQAALLRKILQYNGNNYGNPVEQWIRELKEFLSSAFILDPEEMENICLEDIYTPIDKCISENSSFRGYSVEAIKKIQNQLNTLIAIVLDSSIINLDPKSDYNELFVSKLVSQKHEHPTTDKFSIISTNWDIILDNRFFRHLRGSSSVVDYGCQVAGIDSNDNIIPPLVAKTKGGYTIKFLKIHGSLNWLKCPNCQRIYVSKNEKIAIPEHTLEKKCRICERQAFAANGGINLSPHILMPTFLKSMSDVQFKLIWNQAAKEISEASNIVFIGYSFPQADFELRQLLARHVPNDCNIEVVLHSEDGSGPLPNSDLYWTSPEFRYKSFFLNLLKNVSYAGVEEYVNALRL